MTLLQIILLYYGCVSVFFTETVKAASEVPEYCGKGQVAWCKNFTTSIECQTTKYCQEAVWLTDKPTTNGSCGNCETQIRKIRQSFDSGSRNFDVNELTEGICNSTYDSQFLHLGCQNSLNQYVRYHLQKWLNFLKSNVHPAIVCQVIEVCSRIKSNDSTSGNNFVVGSKNVLHFPANFTEVVESAKPLAASKCTWSSYLCKSLTSSRKCDSTSLCIRRVWSKLQYPEDDDSVCIFCEDMVQRAHNQLQKNKTLEELRGVLRASCKQILIKKVQRECFQLADNFLPELSEMLASSMNSTAICTVASLCNNPRIDSLLKSADGPVLIRMPIDPKNGSDPGPIRENSLCFVCQYLLHFIQEELEKPEEQQKIEEVMNRTCKLAPRSMQTECQSFVFKYGALMISLFSQKIDPSLVCPAIKICPQSVSLEERCLQCQSLVENMTATSGNNHTEQQVLQELSSLMTASNETEEYNHQQDLID